MNFTKYTKNGFRLVACMSAMALLLPQGAIARSYDGYCYQKSSLARTKGTAIGAVTGAIIGSNMAANGRGTEGTILGAVVGGVVGSQIGQQVKQTNRANCLRNAYYRYDGGYYRPQAPPPGYRVAYFYDRPPNVHYVRDNGHHGRRHNHRH